MLSTLKKVTKLTEYVCAVVIAIVLLRYRKALLLLIKNAYSPNGYASFTSILDGLPWNSSYFEGLDGLSPEEKKAFEGLVIIFKLAKISLFEELLFLTALTYGYLYVTWEYRKLESMLASINYRGNTLAVNLSNLADTILNGATRSQFTERLFAGSLIAIIVTWSMISIETISDRVFTAALDIEFVDSICDCNNLPGVAKPRKIMRQSPFYNIERFILLFYCHFVFIFYICVYISLLWSAFQALYPARQVEILKKKCENIDMKDLFLVVGELGTGNWVLLHSVFQNIDSQLFHDLILNMVDRIRRMKDEVNKSNPGL